MTLRTTAEVVRLGGPTSPIKFIRQVMCPDGKRRSAHRIGSFDLMSTAPAVMKVKGVSVSGRISRLQRVDGQPDWRFDPSGGGKYEILLEGLVVMVRVQGGSNLIIPAGTSPLAGGTIVVEEDKEGRIGKVQEESRGCVTVRWNDANTALYEVVDAKEAAAAEAAVPKPGRRVSAAEPELPLWAAVDREKDNGAAETGRRAAGG